MIGIDRGSRIIPFFAFFGVLFLVTETLFTFRQFRASVNIRTDEKIRSSSMY